VSSTGAERVEELVLELLAGTTRSRRTTDCGSGSGSGAGAAPESPRNPFAERLGTAAACTRARTDADEHPCCRADEEIGLAGRGLGERELVRRVAPLAVQQECMAAEQ